MLPVLGVFIITHLQVSCRVTWGLISQSLLPVKWAVTAGVLTPSSPHRASVSPVAPPDSLLLKEGSVAKPLFLFDSVLQMRKLKALTIAGRAARFNNESTGWAVKCECQINTFLV